jgi:hypothetical protein
VLVDGFWAPEHPHSIAGGTKDCIPGHKPKGNTRDLPLTYHRMDGAVDTVNIDRTRSSLLCNKPVRTRQGDQKKGTYLCNPIEEVHVQDSWNE